MAEPKTAGQRLERILLLLPLAGRDGGVSLAEAAERLGVDVATVQDDLEEVTARAFYHPAGGADEMQILLEHDRVKVYSRKFDRPVRLSSREALALAVGLRAAAREVAAGPGAAEREQAIRDLAHRIEMTLAVASKAERVTADDRFEIDYGDDRGGAIRALFREAVRERRRCRVTYLKEGAPEPEERELDPYSVVYASGRWYVIGHCRLRDGVRAFRLDRVIEASLLDSGFERPEAFDPADYLTGGRVFRSEPDVERDVVVRYSASVAPWVREHGPVDELAGGVVAVSYPNADPGWVVRHVLGYGGEAEVTAPEFVRDLVRDAAEAVLTST